MGSLRSECCEKGIDSRTEPGVRMIRNQQKGRKRTESHLEKWLVLSCAAVRLGKKIRMES